MRKLCWVVVDLPSNQARTSCQHRASVQLLGVKCHVARNHSPTAIASIPPHHVYSLARLSPPSSFRSSVISGLLALVFSTLFRSVIDSFCSPRCNVSIGILITPRHALGK